jgi:hyperosmotically inducible periplasmic protein
MRNANLLRNVLVALALATSVAGCAAMSGRETPGEYLDDATITTKVKATIVNELGLSSQIGVETMQNVVQLTGFVDSPQIKTRAGEIARSVSGVRDVRNNIIVR